jgi:hypothetical protein
MPRRARLISATEIVIVIDSSGSLSWFDDDVRDLVRRIDSVTRAKVSVVTASGAPATSPVVAEPSSLASLDDDERAAIRVSPGSRVIALTDLGLAFPWKTSDLRHLEAWIDVAVSLRRREASLVVVTPLHPRRMPRRLSQYAACVSWDRATRPGTLRRQIKALA